MNVRLYVLQIVVNCIPIQEFTLVLQYCCNEISLVQNHICRPTCPSLVAPAQPSELPCMPTYDTPRGEAARLPRVCPMALGYGLPPL